MSSAHLGWYAALGVGGFQLLVNTVLLLRGLTCLGRWRKKGRPNSSGTSV